MKRIFFLLATCVLLFPFGELRASNPLQAQPTATSPALDDWLYLGGATNDVRKLSPLYYIAASAIDTDSTMAANSDTKVASQKATKAAIAAAVISAGSGDMVLASAQTNSGAKTFNDGTLKLGGSTSGTTIVRTLATAGSTSTVIPLYGYQVAYNGLTAPRAVTYPDRDFTVADKTGSFTTGNLIEVDSSGRFKDAGAVKLNVATGIGAGDAGFVDVLDSRGKKDNRFLDVAASPISSTTIDWAVSNSFTKTLAANTTFTFSNVADGERRRVFLSNTSGNYTVTWPTVQWPGNVAPTQTTGAKTDWYEFEDVGGTIYGKVTQNYSVVGAPTSFVPSDASGLTYWFEADGITGSPANNDPIATWNDLSGHSYNAAQATSGSRPLYKTNSINGLPSVHFDGTDDFLITSGESATVKTFFIVVKYTYTGTYAGFVGTRSSGGGLGDSDGTYGASTLNAANKICAFDSAIGGSGADSFVAVDGTSLTTTSFDDYNAGVTASQSTWHLIEWTQTSASLTGAKFFAIGVDPGTSASARHMNGDIALIAVYAGDVSSGNRTNFRNYVATKYGITIAP